MSNRNFKEPLQTRVPIVETRQEESQTPPRDVPAYRQCPACHTGKGGVGRCDGTYKKASTLVVRYYKCDLCAFTWNIRLTPAQVRDDSLTAE